MSDSTQRVQRHTVLAVDDEPGNLEIIKRVLAPDFDVVTSSSGGAALALYEAHDVAVVITDQKMPRMTGLELLVAIAERYPDSSSVNQKLESDLFPSLRAALT